MQRIDNAARPTPGKWWIAHGTTLVAGSTVVGSTDADETESVDVDAANARHIVACVNAMDEVRRLLKDVDRTEYGSCLFVVNKLRDLLGVSQ